MTSCQIRAVVRPAGLPADAAPTTPCVDCGTEWGAAHEYRYGRRRRASRVLGRCKACDRVHRRRVRPEGDPRGRGRRGPEGWQGRYLAALKAGHGDGAACSLAGVDPTAAAKHARRHPEFAAARLAITRHRRGRRRLRLGDPRREDWRPAFLALIRRGHSAKAATRKLRIGRETPADTARRDPGFARDYRAARDAVLIPRSYARRGGSDPELWAAEPDDPGSLAESVASRTALVRAESLAKKADQVKVPRPAARPYSGQGRDDRHKVQWQWWERHSRLWRATSRRLARVDRMLADVPPIGGGAS